MQQTSDRPVSPPWYMQRTLMLVWLLVCAPVGLFALWRGGHFDPRQRWIITGGVVILLLFLLGGPLIETVLIFFAWPAALYLLWRDPTVKPRTLYSFAGVFAVLFLMFLSGAGQNDGFTAGGQCAATFTEGGCTYFRDGDCNVIGRTCN